ncbi:MAG: Zn-dependent alcohol dehydrogenase [Novosphingobium sp.]|nr:Zn-dependent alcohol dehydrogenase [Novosphingobium sp.]MCP5403655.1 Zn-dependent alcohol dehydrogenase [Novosphingobium sp.]
MKAAVMRATNTPMEIEDIAISKPVGREVLVRVAAVGLCHSDLSAFNGTLPSLLPAVLGHEVAGVVEQVGPDAHRLRPGDRVIVCLTFHCGHCEQCHGGNSHRCMTPEASRPETEPPRLSLGSEPLDSFMRIGGFAEQVLVHDSGCIRICDDMPLDRACLIGCGVTTGFGAATRAANVRAGQTIAVIGCGGVGLAAVNGAAVAGAGRIIAVDRVASKLEMARGFGATDGVDASRGSAAEQVMELTGGRGVDHAIEAVGLKPTIELAFGILAKGGVATVVGATSYDTRIELPSIAFLQERVIQGSLMGGVRPSIDIPNYVDLYLQGRLKLDELISRRRPLSEINLAIDDMNKGEIARTVITFDH